MLQELIIALLLALISSMAFMAYQHSAVYRKFYNNIQFWMLALFIIIAVWLIAVEITVSTLSPYIALQQLDKAQQAVEGLHVGRMWVAIGFLLFYAYSKCLYNLEKFIKNTNENDPES